MKRIIRSIMCIIAAFTFFSTASADVKEITFRDIPWESSIQDCLTILKKEFGENIEYESTYYEGSFTIQYRFNIPNLKVAGFPVKGTMEIPNYNLALVFIPNIDENNQSFSTSEGRLIKARYSYIYSNDMSFESVSTELEKKLNGLYGPCQDGGSDKWRKTWEVNDNTVKGWTEMTEGPTTSMGAISITPHIPGGVGLEYSYLPSSIRNDFSILREITNQQSIEKEQEEQRKKEQEEQKRGTDGL